MVTAESTAEAVILVILDKRYVIMGISRAPKWDKTKFESQVHILKNYVTLGKVVGFFPVSILYMWWGEQ